MTKGVIIVDAPDHVLQTPAGTTTPALMGGHPIGAALTSGQTREIDLAMLRCATVSGRILLAGSREPVAGAVVRAVTAGEAKSGIGRRRRSARSDAEGRFVLRGVPAGEVRLRARKSGLHAIDAEEMPVVLAAGLQLTDQIVILSPGVSIEGRVFAPDGSPLSGALVGRVDLKNLGRGAPDLLNVARSDGEGRYRLEGLPGDTQHLLLARHGEHGLPAQEAVRVGVHDLRGIDLRMLRPATLEGRILGTNGLGSAGVEVVWQRAQRPTTPERIGLLPTRRFAARTDAEGRFRLAGLPPETGWVSVTGDAAKGLWIHPDHGKVELASGQSKSVVFQLQERPKRIEIPLPVPR